jgi:hypothetical protein
MAHFTARILSLVSAIAIFTKGGLYRDFEVSAIAPSQGSAAEQFSTVDG